MTKSRTSLRIVYWLSSFAFNAFGGDGKAHHVRILSKVIFNKAIIQMKKKKTALWDLDCKIIMCIYLSQTLDLISRVDWSSSSTSSSFQKVQRITHAPAQ